MHVSLKLTIDRRLSQGQSALHLCMLIGLHCWQEAKAVAAAAAVYTMMRLQNNTVMSTVVGTTNLCSDGLW